MDNQVLNKKVIPAVVKFTQLRGIAALKDGLVATMPLTIAGSIFLLLAQLPFAPLANFISNMGWDGPLFQAYGATFGILAMAAVFSMAYYYVKNAGFEGLSAGLIALSAFVLTNKGYVVEAISGETVGNVIDKTWTGGQGMVTAIIIGLLTGAVYTFFLRRDIRIKMPAGVPQGVANAFTALIPAIVILTATMLVYAIFNAYNTTLVEAIYSVIQIPLQGLTDSLGGVIAISFLPSFLWWFGVHGSTIVNGVMDGILQSNTIANQAIIDSGLELTRENGGHIVTSQFFANFIIMTGAGITIGIVLYMVFFAKSKQSKQLGRLSLLPAIFNINEPILFATPIVMNVFMFIPFVLVPMLTGIIQYFALYVGLVPLYNGIIPPWTTPPILSGFLFGGWRTALLQAVILVMSFFIYMPFMRKIDKINVEAERAAATSGKGE